MMVNSFPFHSLWFSSHGLFPGDPDGTGPLRPRLVPRQDRDTSSQHALWGCLRAWGAGWRGEEEGAVSRLVSRAQLCC